jgi:hypothetical protein
MGGANILCGQKRVGTETINLECPAGVMFVDDSLHIGMMSSKVGAMIHCTEKSIWKSEDKNEIADCTATLDTELFKTRMQDCNMKEKCEVDITGLQPPNTKECGDKAFVYIQLPCEI